MSKKSSDKINDTVKTNLKDEVLKKEVAGNADDSGGPESSGQEFGSKIGMPRPQDRSKSRSKYR